MTASNVAGLVSIVLLGAAVTGKAQDTVVADVQARVAAAQARLSALNARAERVADLNAIENLQRSFGYYVDKMLWEHVVDLFTADATVEIGPSGIYAGADSIRRYFYSLSGGQQGPLEGELYNHLQLQPVITLADDGHSARGRWRAWILTRTHGAGSGGNWGEGPYENEYAKDDGVWKISKLHWYATFMAPYEGGWKVASEQAVNDYAMGRGVQPDQASSEDYRPYPGVYVPPFHFDNPVSGD